jgi:hypothetical protein
LRIPIPDAALRRHAQWYGIHPGLIRPCFDRAHAAPVLALSDPAPIPYNQ